MKTTKTIWVRKKHMRPMPEGSDATRNCMVARALMDAGITNATVGFATATVNGYFAFLPDGVTEKIQDFCTGKKVKPFQFTLTYEARA